MFTSFLVLFFALFFLAFPQKIYESYKTLNSEEMAKLQSSGLFDRLTKMLGIFMLAVSGGCYSTAKYGTHPLQRKVVQWSLMPLLCGLLYTDSLALEAASKDPSGIYSLIALHATLLVAGIYSLYCPVAPAN